MVPAVAQIKSGTPAKSLPLANFVFIPRQIQIKTPYCGERERDPELAGVGRCTTPTAGYLHWRGGFPPPTPSFRHAKNRGEFCFVKMSRRFSRDTYYPLIYDDSTISLLL